MGALRINNDFLRLVPEKKGIAEKKRLSSYRFGFNGQEKDDEWDGVTGSKLDFGNRVLDTRIGRLLSLDKYSSKYPSESNYIFAGNSPVYLIDVNGDFKWPTGEKGKKLAKKYPHTYKYIMEKDKTKPNIQVMGSNKIIQKALIDNSYYANQDKIPAEFHIFSSDDGVDFSQEQFKLTPKIIEEAFTPGSGPTILPTDAPGGTASAGGYNDGTDGTKYSTPLEINSKLFQNIEDAINNGSSDKVIQTQMLRLVSTIIHEYEEDFSSDAFHRDADYNETGVYNAQYQIYEVGKPGLGDMGDAFQVFKYLNGFKTGTDEKQLIPDVPK